MQEIKYRIDDEMGLHARPAGILVKLAATFKCDIQIGNASLNGTAPLDGTALLDGTPAKMANAKRIIGVMALTLKQGDEMIMTFNGEDETEAAAALRAFLEENQFSPIT